MRSMESLGMSDLQKDAKHWHGRILDLIASIHNSELKWLKN